ncbi:hypothetical protein ACVWZ6_002517 [Bradyrhizobium sp. GM6.1]
MPGREFSPSAEHGRIGRGRNESRGRYRTNSGTGGKRLRHRIYFVDLSQLSLDGIHLLVQFLQLVHKNHTGIAWQRQPVVIQHGHRPLPPWPGQPRTRIKQNELG